MVTEPRKAGVSHLIRVSAGFQEATVQDPLGAGRVRQPPDLLCLGAGLLTGRFALRHLHLNCSLCVSEDLNPELLHVQESKGFPIQTNVVVVGALKPFRIPEGRAGG